jgi:hypothetical protein
MKSLRSTEASATTRAVYFYFFIAFFFPPFFVDVRRTPSTFQPTHMPCWPSAASCSGGYVLALRLMVAEKMSSPPTIESVTISTLFLEDT